MFHTFPVIVNVQVLASHFVYPSNAAHIAMPDINVLSFFKEHRTFKHVCFSEGLAEEPFLHRYKCIIFQ